MPQDKVKERELERKRYDYQVYVNNSDPGILHTVRHELLAARRTMGSYSLEFLLDTGRKAVGFIIVESPFTPPELELLLKRSVAEKDGYRIEELSRNPLELRRKLRESKEAEDKAIK